MSPAANRALALGLLALMVATGFAAIGLPLVAAHAHLDQRIETARRILAVGVLAPDIQAQLPDSLEALRQRAAAEPAWLPKEGDSLAGAALQNRIRLMVESQGGELRSTQILPAAAEGDLRRIGVRAQFAAATESLQGILYGLESRMPFLFLDNVSLRRRAGQRINAQPEEERLDVTMDVFGYMRNAGP